MNQQPRSQAERIERKHRGLFLGRVSRLLNTTAGAPACEYGHFECSDHEGGACSDEMQHLIEAEHGDDYNQLAAVFVPSDRCPRHPGEAIAVRGFSVPCGLCEIEGNDALEAERDDLLGGR